MLLSLNEFSKFFEIYLKLNTFTVFNQYFPKSFRKNIRETPKSFFLIFAKTLNFFFQTLRNLKDFFLRPR